MSVQASEVEQNIAKSPKVVAEGTEGELQQENSEAKADGEKTEEHKLFVSNFPHNYTTQQVEEHFSSAGKILKVKIILRNKRSMGYGFVTFDDAESAEKAIELFNGQEIEGRALKVEAALEKTKSTKPKSKPRRKSQKKPTDANETGENQEEGSPEAGETEGKPKSTRPRRNKKRSSTVPKDTTGSQTQNGSADASAKKDSADGASDDQDESKSKSKAGTRNNRRRSGNPRRRSHTGEPSLTSLYVSNLPFSLTDEGLLQVFGTFGAVKAHVVRNSHYKRSKGYGFVEFSNNDDQQRALKDLGEVEINGRVLSVSIALNRPSSGDEAEPAQPQSEPAPVEA